VPAARVVLAAVLLSSGCAGADGPTSLTLRAEQLGRSVSYVLRCDPPGGDVPRPDVLCTALDDDSRLLRTLPPPPRETRNGRVVVHGCLVGVPSFAVVGTYRGADVDARFSACTPSDNPGLVRWADLLGIGAGEDPAFEPLWAASRRAGHGPVESLSRVTKYDLSIFEPVRRVRVKYESDRCEIWLVRRAGNGVRVAKASDERPCYAFAPWRKFP
jgi:hypothetical protein